MKAPAIVRIATSKVYIIQTKFEPLTLLIRETTSSLSLELDMVGSTFDRITLKLASSSMITGAGKLTGSPFALVKSEKTPIRLESKALQVQDMVTSSTERSLKHRSGCHLSSVAEKPIHTV